MPTQLMLKRGRYPPKKIQSSHLNEHALNREPVPLRDNPQNLEIGPNRVTHPLKECLWFSHTKLLTSRSVKRIFKDGDPFANRCFLMEALISFERQFLTSLNFIRLLRVVITPLVTSESTGRQCRPVTSVLLDLCFNSCRK